MLAAAAPAVTIRAQEAGIITALSEKVYLEKSIGSTVLANVLQGSAIEILFTEADDAGGLWFYIRTDTGLEGYLPAQSAMPVTAQEQETPQEAPNEASNEASNDAPAETPNEASNDAPDETPNEASSEATEEAKLLTTLDNVNIRESASAASRIKGTIPRGTQISCIESIRNEQDEVWYSVIYQGIEGYISEVAVNADIAVVPEEIESEQVETQQTETQQTETETKQTETAQIETAQAQTSDVKEEESLPFSEETPSGHHLRIRLPEGFEIALVAAIGACGAAIVFLVKKIKKML